MTARRLLLAVLGSALLVSVLGGVRGAVALAASRTPAIEISVIHATRADAGASIDPRLRDLPQLTRDEPFLRYNVYTLLDRKVLALDPDRPATSVLPNGRTLQVTLADVGEDAGGKRFHVRAEIGEPGKKAFLKLLEVTASANEPFFVGGQSYEGGTLFLEFVVRRQ
ncbi:MAG TPA: hypothetical protein VH137_00815 [Gemmatimonadales bacterium]|nr:hypothetical protein [Gemmatimonadales bacterium]